MDNSIILTDAGRKLHQQLVARKLLEGMLGVFIQDFEAKHYLDWENNDLVSFQVETRSDSTHNPSVQVLLQRKEPIPNVGYHGLIFPLPVALPVSFLNTSVSYLPPTI